MRRHILAWLAGFCVLSIHPTDHQSIAHAQTAADYITLEDFADTPVDSLPRGWRWRSKDDDKPKLYAVHEANGQHYLAAQDTGHSVVLFKRIELNPHQYPIVTWCWRVDDLPVGGDERYTETNDSAAAVHIIASKTFFLGIPRQIKYVWSTTLEPGTIGRRKGIGRPWFVVLESGAEKLGQWVMEQVDIEHDYQRTFTGALPDDERTMAIGVLTDANQTRSFARAAYADFRAWPRAALGQITNYCATLSGGQTTVLSPR